MIRKIKKIFNYWAIRKGINNNCLYQKLIKLNYRLFHSSEQLKKVSFGDLNADKTFFVIQLTDKSGIFSTLGNALAAMKWAEENAYVPVIDMVDEEAREGDGSFFKYFISKASFSLEEVYKSRNVILSGVEKYPDAKAGFGYLYDKESARMMKNYIETHIGFSEEVIKNVKKEEALLDENTLGVFLRGTDYVAMEPYYHPIQPQLEEVIDSVNDFMQTHEVSRIFLVTEDWGIYIKFKERFGKLLYISGGEEHFIKNYSGKTYIADCIKDTYSQNLEYITRIILLARCRWLIASITNGSKMAIWLNGAVFEETFLFEKGYYRVPEK